MKRIDFPEFIAWLVIGLTFLVMTIVVCHTQKKKLTVQDYRNWRSIGIIECKSKHDGEVVFRFDTMDGRTKVWLEGPSVEFYDMINKKTVKLTRKDESWLDCKRAE